MPYSSIVPMGWGDSYRPTLWGGVRGPLGGATVYNTSLNSQKLGNNKVAHNSSVVLIQRFKTRIRHFRHYCMLHGRRTADVHMQAPPTPPPSLVRYTNRPFDIEGGMPNVSSRSLCSDCKLAGVYRPELLVLEPSQDWVIYYARYGSHL